MAGGENDVRKGQGEKGRSRAHWNDAQIKFLVSMIKEYHLSARYRGQNGWTKEGWNCMTARLNNKYLVSNFTVAQLKDREQRLKKNHNILKSIVSKSGFGWDPDLKVPTAIDEKWQELSEDQQKWRNKPFPFYDDLYDIYDGKVTEGKRCRRTTDLHAEKQMTNSLSQEHIVNEVFLSHTRSTDVHRSLRLRPRTSDLQPLQPPPVLLALRRSSRPRPVKMSSNKRSREEEVRLDESDDFEHDFEDQSHDSVEEEEGFVSAAGNAEAPVHTQTPSSVGS